jgi:hypothetical protein
LAVSPPIAVFLATGFIGMPVAWSCSARLLLRAEDWRVGRVVDGDDLGGVEEDLSPCQRQPPVE